MIPVFLRKRRVRPGDEYLARAGDVVRQGRWLSGGTVVSHSPVITRVGDRISPRRSSTLKRARARIVAGIRSGRTEPPAR